MKNNWKKILYINFTFLFLVALVMEFVLQFASAEIPVIEYITSSPDRFARVHGPQMLPDERLGRRGNPEYPEYDSRGFRNGDALTRATVVALGDSHTFGTNVRATEAWPSVLATELVQPVYNMGLGSYSAAHNNHNLSIALALKPKVVVFALYFGNDFIDDFNFARRNKSLSTLAPANIVRAVQARKPDHRLTEEVEFLFGNARNNENGGGAAESLFEFTEALTDHSRLYGFLRTLKNFFFPRQANGILNREGLNETAASRTSGRDASISLFDDGAWNTIFTARYRALVVDNEDPRVRAGMSISKHMIARMDERVRNAGAKFLVMLIPTKEFVFWPKVRQPGQHPHLTELVENEDILRQELMTYLNRQGIDYVDPAPALRSAAAQPYFANADGHPNPLGHKIIAKALRKASALNGALIATAPPTPNKGPRSGQDARPPAGKQAR